LTTEKNISLPSGEKVGYVSSLFSSDMIPGANISGIFPGGFCPRYELPGETLCEYPACSINIKAKDKSVGFMVSCFFVDCDATLRQHRCIFVLIYKTEPNFLV
jgi:hypothetical protein